MDGIKYITPTLLEEITNATQTNTSMIDALWDTLEGPNIHYSERRKTDTAKTVTIDGIKEKYPLFPKTRIGDSDIVEDIILVKSSISQLSYGNTRPIYNLKMIYNDWINKTKTSPGTTPFIQGVGPWITLSYSRTLVEYLGKGNYVDKLDQTLSPDESGTMKVQFKIQNTGNEHSYYTKYEIIIEPNLTYVDSNVGTNRIDVKKNEFGQTILTFDYGAPIMAGEPKGGLMYLNYTGICDSYEILTLAEKQALPKALPVANRSAVYLKVLNSSTAKTATQQLRQPLTFAYTIKAKTTVYMDLVLSGKRSNPTVTIKPKINYYDNDTEKNISIYIGKADVTRYYSDLRKLEETENLYKYETIYTKGNYIKQQKDHPIQKERENKNHVVLYTVLLYRKGNNGKDILISSNSMKYEQRNIHLSTAEAVLVLLSIIFFAAAVFFIWRVYMNWKEINSGKVEKSVKNTKLDKLLG